MGVDAHHLRVNMARQLAYHAFRHASFTQLRHELVPEIIKPQFRKARDWFETIFFVALVRGGQVLAGRRLATAQPSVQCALRRRRFG
jgi:hypothetical protein